MTTNLAAVYGDLTADQRRVFDPFLLGWLQSAIDTDGTIDTGDWSKAIAAARKFAVSR